MRPTSESWEPNSVTCILVPVEEPSASEADISGSACDTRNKGREQNLSDRSWKAAVAQLNRQRESVAP